MAIIRGLDNDLSLDEANRIQMMKLEEKVNFFHILLHIKQTYQPPPPLRIRHTHTEKRRA